MKYSPVFFIFLVFGLFTNIPTINASPSGTIFFLDSTGHQDENAHHYNIGGHLFAGEYPINNPVNTGDTGIVYLYRMVGNKLFPSDNSRVVTLGYFAFVSALEGEYLIKAELTKYSTHRMNYFPTYFSSSLKWDVSSSLSLHDSNQFESNIHLLPSNDSLSGPASMSGYISQSMNDQTAQRLGNTEILLFNETMVPLTFSFSDNSGNFSFLNLPFGTYYLLVESSGKFPIVLKVTLDQNHPLINNLKLEVFSHAPSSIQKIPDQSDITLTSIYPNPTDSEVNISLQTNRPETILINLFDLQQRVIFEKTVTVNGTVNILVPLYEFPTGEYFIFLQNLDNSWSVNKRFIKY
ncbi:MAG: T9SS type A sorting domain-containing protein [Bacteroidota bacterium]